MSGRSESTRHPRFSYSNGKLYRFDRGRVVVMAAWPDPRAWCRTPTSNWRPTSRWADAALNRATMPPSGVDMLQFVVERVFDFDGDELSARRAWRTIRVRLQDPRELFSQSFAWPAWVQERDREALRREMHEQLSVANYLAIVPEAIRSELMTLSERRWLMLNFFARVPGGVEFYQRNPGLAFGLAGSREFHLPRPTRPYRIARPMVGTKQRWIAGWLGYPETDAMARILGKIEKPALSIRRLLRLRKVVADSAVLRSLSHLERINSDALTLVMSKRLRSRVAPRLLTEASRQEAQRSDGTCTVADMLRETIDLARCQGDRKIPRQFLSLSHLQDAYLDLRLRRQRGEVIEEQDNEEGEFPPPPFLGTSDILPIQSAASLTHEAIAMSNCVDGFVRRVADGNIYFYRVLRPISATISLVRDDEGRWGSGEVRGPGNSRIAAIDAKHFFDELCNSPMTL